LPPGSFPALILEGFDVFPHGLDALRVLVLTVASVGSVHYIAVKSAVNCCCRESLAPPACRVSGFA
jgi:hypothetical protein